MKSYALRVVLEEDSFEDGRTAYRAYCPALPGCQTWGHTRDEAMVNIREAVELVVDALIEEGKSLPTQPGRDIVELDSPSVVVNV